MEIRFSREGEYASLVDVTARKHVQYVRHTSAHKACVRFTLPGADQAQHDNVIRALLTLDPDAVVRTARAVYEGRDDFERQYAARMNAEVPKASR